MNNGSPKRLVRSGLVPAAALSVFTFMQLGRGNSYLGLVAGVFIFVAIYFGVRVFFQPKPKSDGEPVLGSIKSINGRGLKPVNGNGLRRLFSKVFVASGHLILRNGVLIWKPSGAIAALERVPGLRIEMSDVDSAHQSTRRHPRSHGPPDVDLHIVLRDTRRVVISISSPYDAQDFVPYFMETLAAYQPLTENQGKTIRFGPPAVHRMSTFARVCIPLACLVVLVSIVAAITESASARYPSFLDDLGGYGVFGLVVAMTLVAFGGRPGLYAALVSGAIAVIVALYDMTSFPTANPLGLCLAIALIGLALFELRPRNRAALSKSRAR